MRARALIGRPNRLLRQLKNPTGAAALVQPAPLALFSATSTVSTATPASPSPLAAALALLLVTCAAQTATCEKSTTTSIIDEGESDEDAAPEAVTNWSNTHICYPSKIYEPTSLREVQEILWLHHLRRQPVRVRGGALSPNGIGLCDDGTAMINLVDFDKVLSVDHERRTVTVQPGIKVGDLCEYLISEHGLTLENLASIAEQQVGGFVSVGAHGTGARLPSVDMQVESMKLATPALGTLTLSREEHPHLFDLARVSLGALGVVVEVTLRCVPAHDLLEHTYAVTRDFIRANHERLLREHRHIRFMWVPYTDTVVVVTNDPVPPELIRDPNRTLGGSLSAQRERLHSNHDMTKLPSVPLVNGATARKVTNLEATEPMRALLAATVPPTEGEGFGDDPSSSSSSSAPSAAGADAYRDMGFAELRDKLLAVAPLDVDWIKKVNAAEAEFWIRSESFRISRNVDLLQFDCGGEQWVSEVVFPAGSLERPTGSDLLFMEEVLGLIEAENIPAPAPIEQRWSSDSASLMSPSHATPAQQARMLAPATLSDTFHSWVGIIMYLPSEDPNVRRAITENFLAYKKLCAEKIWGKYDAQEHWAKIEIPGKEIRKYEGDNGKGDVDTEGMKVVEQVTNKNEGPTSHDIEARHRKDLRALQSRLRARFPLDAFSEARRLLDPHQVLANTHLKELMPLEK